MDHISVYLILYFSLGVIPNSDFLKGSMVEVDSRSAITVDKVRYLLIKYNICTTVCLFVFWQLYVLVLNISFYSYVSFDV